MQFFNALASNAKNMKRLLTLNNARAVFTDASTAVAMQADSVILPISNVAQTTQTLTLYRRNYFIKKKNWKGDFYEVMGMRNVTN